MLTHLIDKYYIKNPKLRRFVTRLLEGDKEHSIVVLGTRLAVHSVKEHGYLRASRAARRSSLYGDEAAVIINLAVLLSAEDTFVDVGANVGLFCCTLARRSRLDGGRTRFVAVEANPDTFARLRKSAEPLGITTYQCAASNHEGSLEFVSGAVSHVFTTIDHRNSYNIRAEQTTVPCHRLDGLNIPGESLVIKIDVEGQEREVLEGAAGLFAGNRVKAVYLDGFVDSGVPGLLRDYGFRLLEGRTLEPSDGKTFSLLALRPALNAGR